MSERISCWYCGIAERTRFGRWLLGKRLAHYGNHRLCAKCEVIPTIRATVERLAYGR